MIDSIDSKLNGSTITTLPEYLNYSVTYDDGTELEQNHQLLANTTETYKVRIEYKTDINLNQIPATNQTLSLQFTVTYRQATSDSIQRDRYVYTANIDDFENQIGLIQFGEAIPNTITQYNNPQEALAAMRSEFEGNNINVYLKHLIRNGVVEESYIEFIVTPEIVNEYFGVTSGTYAIRGINLYDGNHNCKEEYYNSTTGECVSPYYESNKSILLNVFGNGNCNYTYNCYCSGPGFHFSITKNGRLSARINENWYIQIDYDGSGGINGQFY